MSAIPHGLDKFEAPVAEADQEATEAERLATAIEERVRNGDAEVTPDELDKARSLSGFAKLRADAARRRADRDREAERQRQLTALRAEIEQATPATGQHLAELLRTAQTALDDFLTATRERNDQVNAWRRNMQDLGVPELATPMPLADHQRMGWRDSTIVLGDANQVNALNAPQFVAQMLCDVAVNNEIDPTLFGQHHGNRDPYTQLRRGY